MNSPFIKCYILIFQVLMFACLPYSLGWVTTSMAKSVYVLYLSRLLVGISHALLTTTVYTGIDFTPLQTIKKIFFYF